MGNENAMDDNDEVEIVFFPEEDQRPLFGLVHFDGNTENI
jgi:hypothetical protein